MPVNSVPFINSVASGLFRLPGQPLWRCRPTRWCLVFCSPPRLFHRDAKLTTLTRTCYRLTVSPWPLASQPSTGTGKKLVTATQTAP